MEQNKDNAQDLVKAIAIKGNDAGSNAPPKIIAKGEGALAEKLLDIAFAEGVKVRKDKDLTELLDAFDVESPIPLEALHAVSLILERVYKENKAMSGEDIGGDTSSTSAAAKVRADGVIDGATGRFAPNIANGKAN